LAIAVSANFLALARIPAPLAVTFLAGGISALR
jgi:hypothetical protein